jgi:hypothetical protein
MRDTNMNDDDNECTGNEGLLNNDQSAFSPAQLFMQTTFCQEIRQRQGNQRYFARQHNGSIYLKDSMRSRYEDIVLCNLISF